MTVDGLIKKDLTEEQLNILKEQRNKMGAETENIREGTRFKAQGTRREGYQADLEKAEKEDQIRDYKDT